MSLSKELDVLEWLQHWYTNQCNGEWEHEHGVSIQTLDNPGWMIVIDLKGTPFESQASDESVARSGEPPGIENGNMGGPTWLECSIKQGQFRGAGDAGQLEAILREFQAWITANSPTEGT